MPKLTEMHAKGVEKLEEAAEILKTASSVEADAFREELRQSKELTTNGFEAA